MGKGKSTAERLRGLHAKYDPRWENLKTVRIGPNTAAYIAAIRATGESATVLVRLFYASSLLPFLINTVPQRLTL